MSAAACGTPVALESPSRLARLGGLLLCVFLFLAYSRVADFALGSLRLPLVTSIACLIVAVLTGGVRRAFASPPGLLLTFLTVWLVLAVPFSYWKGGSFETIKELWSKSFLAYFITAGLIRTLSQCRRAMYAIAFAGAAIAVMSVLFQNMSADGRLALTDGVLANPNYLAQILLMSLTFWLLPTGPGRWRWLRSILAGTIAVRILGALISAGSRGAFLALMCVVAFMFFEARLANKIRSGVVLALVCVAAFPLLPSTLKDRYRTLLWHEEDEVIEGQESALGSTKERTALLKLSIRFTLEHPLFGVGPGVFEAASADEAKDRNEKELWRETHNSYTQVSSEAGLPALAFYLGTLLWCLKTGYSLYRRARDMQLEDIRRLSYCLTLCLISFAVTAFFSSVAYDFYLPTLAGIAAPLVHCSEAEIRRRYQRVGPVSDSPGRAVPSPAASPRQAVSA